MAVLFFGKYSRSHKVASVMEVVEKFTNKWYNLVQLRATN